MPLPLIAIGMIVSAAVPVVVGAAAWADSAWNGGRITKSLVGGVLRSVGEAKEEAANEVASFSLASKLDQLGEWLTPFIPGIGNWLRHLGQRMMGKSEDEITYGIESAESTGRGAAVPESSFREDILTVPSSSPLFNQRAAGGTAPQGSAGPSQQAPALVPVP